MDTGNEYSLNSRTGVVEIAVRCKGRARGRGRCIIDQALVETVVRCKGRGRGRGRCIIDPSTKQVPLPASAPLPAWRLPNEAGVVEFGKPAQPHYQNLCGAPAVQDTLTEGCKVPTSLEQSTTGCKAPPQNWQQRSPSRSNSPHQSLSSSWRVVPPDHCLPEALRRSSGKENLIGNATRDPSGSQAPQDLCKDISFSQSTRSPPGPSSRGQHEQQQKEPDDTQPRLGKRSIVEDALRDPSGSQAPQDLCKDISSSQSTRFPPGPSSRGQQEQQQKEPDDTQPRLGKISIVEDAMRDPSGSQAPQDLCKDISSSQSTRFPPGPSSRGQQEQQQKEPDDTQPRLGKISIVEDAMRDPSGSQAPQDLCKVISFSQSTRFPPGPSSRAQHEQQQKEPDDTQPRLGKRSIVEDAMRDPSGSQAPQDLCKDISSSQSTRSPPGPSSRGQHEQQQKEPDDTQPRLGKISIVEDAMRDPNSLTFRGIRCLVRSVYRLAARESEHAQCLAEFCAHLVTNDRSNVYLFTILGVGRSWFKERDRLLPRHPPATSGPQTWPPMYHWTAYVTFVATLLSTLNQKARNWMAPSVPLWCNLHFAELLCDCCEIMVQSVPHDVAAEPSTGCKAPPHNWQQRSPSRGCSPRQSLISCWRVTPDHYLPKALPRSSDQKSLIGDTTEDSAGTQAPQNQWKGISTSQSTPSVLGRISRGQHEQQQTETDAAEARFQKSILKDAVHGPSGSQAAQNKCKDLSTYQSTGSLPSEISHGQLEQLQKEPKAAKPRFDGASLYVQALHDQNSLTFVEITALVQFLYKKALKDPKKVQSAANFCARLVTIDRSNTYLLTILGVGRSWFHDRNLLLPRRPPTASGPHTWPPKYLWTAFVEFIACLVSTFNRKSRNPMAVPVPVPYTSHFAEILCNCCDIMVLSMGHDVAAEVKCLRYVFTSVGNFVAASSPMCMTVLARCIRDVLRNPRLKEAAQGAFEDVPELRALAWEYEVP